jgi:hypothetical protein
LLAAAILGLAPFVNGYPLFFPDSGTYIRQAVKFEGVLDRPPFYSFFIELVHLRLSLWPIPFVQDVIACYVIFRAFMIAFPSVGAPRMVLSIMFAGLLTSLPWFSNQIMPDIFTPLIVLNLFIICLAWDHLVRAERVLIPVLLAGMIACHQANTPFTLFVLVAALLLGWSQGIPRRLLLRRTLLVIVPVGLAVLGQSLYSYVIIKRFTPSPYAPVFLLARLLDDGPARRYLATACPAEGYALCQYQDALRGDSNAFLWAPDSPLWILLRERGKAETLDEANAIVRGALRAYPGAALSDALRNAAMQFVHAATADENCPCLGDKADHVVAELFPHEYPSYLESMQNRGTLPWRMLGWIDGIVVIVSAIFLAVLALRKRCALAGDAGRLLALIAWGCLVNAGLMGALSGVANRYQARIVWLIPLFAVVILMSERLHRAAPADYSAAFKR